MTGGAIRSAGSQLITAAAGSLTTLAVAAILGPGGAGEYAVALALYLAVFTISTAGLQTGIAYAVSSGRWSPRSAFRQTQTAALVFGVSGAALGWLATELLPGVFRGVSSDALLLTLAAVPPALSWTFASAVALADDRYEIYAYPPAAQAALGLTGGVALAAIDGVTGTLAAVLASHMVTALGTVIVTARAVGSHDEGPAHSFRPALWFGLQTHASTVLSFVNYRFDVFLLNAVASQATVGQYSIAVSVTSAGWLLPRALSSVLTPRVARLDSIDASAEREMVEAKSIRHTVLVIGGSTVVLAVLLVVLVELILGPDFGPAIGYGLILLPGSAFVGLSSTLAAIIVGRGHALFALKASLLVTPLSVLVYVLLIPSYEAIGAAVASSCSYAVGALVGAHYFRISTGYSVRSVLLPTRGEIDDYRALLARPWGRRSTARNAVEPR